MSSFHPLTLSFLLTRIKFSFKLYFQLPRCLFLLLLLSKAERLEPSTRDWSRRIAKAG